MLVTLITDASWCPGSRVGGWASWARGNGAKMAMSGQLRGIAHSSTEAEMMALVNGLHVTVQGFRLMAGDRVLVQSDCVPALEQLALDHGAYEGVRKAWHSLVQARGLLVEYRHVRGHEGGHSARSWVNEWADREAKKHMRAARPQELREEIAAAKRARVKRAK